MIRQKLWRLLVHKWLPVGGLYVMDDKTKRSLKRNLAQQLTRTTDLLPLEKDSRHTGSVFEAKITI